MSSAEEHLLHRLARLFKVQTVYYDAMGRLIAPTFDAVLQVLRMLGAPLQGRDDLRDAVRERRLFLWRRGIEPVLVAWDTDFPQVLLRLPARLADVAVDYSIELESGELLQGRCKAAPPIAGREIEGVFHVARRLTIGQALPFGYHRLELRARDSTFAAFLFISPRQAHAAAAGARSWGIFCPLHAIASGNSWGAGNLSDLGSMMDFASQRGAAVLGTLPLLSTFLNELFNPSPYAPVSRLFWNEFYIDVTRVPEVRQSPAARAIIDSPGFQDELKQIRAAPLVEYRRSMTAKRTVLEAAMGTLFKKDTDRRRAFETFVTNHPLVLDYAAFRAKVEREERSWEHWPAASRDGMLRPGDFAERAKNYHVYVQWLVSEQLGELTQARSDRRAALYLDFPLGVNRDGYDVWRRRAVFALEASGGAPPDAFFTKGQNWGFPPLQTDRLRYEGYGYYIQCLRHHLRHAGMLRIDHVMGLHRSYWIPSGFAATEGVYVHSRPEEFYAILCLESHRQQAQIVGENLGTVPPYVDAAMRQHKIFGMQVSQFLVSGDPRQALHGGSSTTVASLNTHDTPTFAGFWNGEDIRDRLGLGIISAAEADDLQRERKAQCDRLVHELVALGELGDADHDLTAILRAWLRRLAATNEGLLLINLEDLWLEIAPQNVPGTWEERPNWRRKARVSLEQLRGLSAVEEVLNGIDQIRRSHRAPL